MRIAIVSDIHGNLTALRAVLGDLRMTAPDVVVHGGDLADSGSAPAETVDLIRELGWPGVFGNTDEMLFAPDKLVEFIQITHFDDVGVCFDLGHAHIMGKVAEAFEILKRYIHSTHVHDNAGERDSHLWPGAGTIDWKAAMELLRSAPHTPPLLLEIEGDEKVNPVEKMDEAFRKLVIG